MIGESRRQAAHRSFVQCRRSITTKHQISRSAWPPSSKALTSELALLAHGHYLVEDCMLLVA